MITRDTLDAMTPEETRALRRAGERLLKSEIDERFAHTKIIARAGGMRF